MAHTPGPLSVKRSKLSIDGEYDYAIYNERDRIIAEAYGRTSVNSRPDAHANALLFAAAPDLLEACKSVWDEIATIAVLPEGNNALFAEAVWPSVTNLADRKHLARALQTLRDTVRKVEGKP